jgi:CelD/BcsL family acetyltransferase involved in cellulose biosynthesis
MELRVEELASLEACVALRTQWDELAATASNISVFSTWEWQATWWKHYGADDSLRVMVVRENELVVGILPLYSRRVPLAPLVTSRELRLLGTGGDTSPDYLGPLIRPAHEAAVATVLAERLVARPISWDVLRLTDLRPGVFLDVLVERLRATSADVDVRAGSRIRIVRLPSRWEEYLANMPGDRRRRIGNLRRNVLNKLGGRFEATVTTTQLPSAIEDLITLHRKRWSSKGTQTSSFQSASYVDFHREVIARCHDKGWIRLYRIEANGKTVAIFYCYRYRGDVLFFQTGFDPELEHFRLGQVLMAFSIESAITEGASVFDMLKGEHEYKSSWSNDVRDTFDLIAYNRSIRGRLGRLRREVGVLKRAASRKSAGLRSLIQL